MAESPAPCAALLLLPLTAAAEDLPDAIVKLQVLPGWEAADSSRMAGLSFRLAPGWKTYWRAPARRDPPAFDWSGRKTLLGHNPLARARRVPAERHAQASAITIMSCCR